jgi:type II secretory pathway pseudopilin PulG
MIGLNKKGFTMVELLVVMGLTLFVMVASSRVMITMITQFKQQSKIAESGVESIVGLEVLRQDLMTAGAGLPTSMMSYDTAVMNVVNWSGLDDYAEAAEAVPALFNDAPGGPPRPMLSRDVAGTVNNSDYLAIKAINIGLEPQCEKFHTLAPNGAVNVWSDVSWNLEDSAAAVVMSLRGGTRLVLVPERGNVSNYYARMDDLDNFASTDVNETRYVYGISGLSTIRAPFNRADYYISTARIPRNCAPGTGVLVKAVMQQTDGTLGPEMPLVDCVADFQVVYGLDTDNDSEVNSWSNDVTGLDVNQHYDRVREVTAYILTHDGGKDPRFEYPSTTVYVGNGAQGRNVTLTGLPGIGDNWKHYRWRLLQISVRPLNLRDIED